MFYHDSRVYLRKSGLCILYALDSLSICGVIARDFRSVTLLKHLTSPYITFLLRLRETFEIRVPLDTT